MATAWAVPARLAATRRAFVNSRALAESRPRVLLSQVPRGAPETVGVSQRFGERLMDASYGPSQQYCIARLEQIKSDGEGYIPNTLPFTS